MGKAPTGGEAKSGGEPKKEGAGHSAPVQQQSSEPKPKMATKGHNPLPDGCHGWGCKAKSHRFNFCDEHYDQFKFGLIRKTGEQVSDFEKKFEHYQAHKRRGGAQKAA